MRVAMLYDVDDLRIEHIETPVLQAGELLVKVSASGICSGDLMPWYIRKKAPLVLGHEPVGTIVAIGHASDTTSGAPALDRHGRPFAIGDRVAIHHHAPCMHCRACERGDYVQCAAWRQSRIDPGGIAEYIRVPHANLLDTQILPAEMRACDAVFVEPLGCVMKSLDRACVIAEDVVYVIGLGIMGLLHVAMLAEQKVQAFGSDYHAARRERGLALGASAVFHPQHALAGLHEATEQRGADVVICGPGSSTALLHAIEACAPGGRVLMFTPLEPGTPFPLDQASLYFRDLSLIASYSCGPDDTAAALAAIDRGVVSCERLGVTSFPLEESARAYTRMSAMEEIKSIVEIA